MKFINMGGPVKIRIGKANDCYWTTIRKGEIVDLSPQEAKGYGFTIKTTKGQMGGKKVETKQIEHDSYVEGLKDGIQAERDGVVCNVGDFFKELCKVKGIGKKTAKDIVNWGTKEKLIEAIAMRGSLPFRDDIENLLRKNYGH